MDTESKLSDLLYSVFIKSNTLLEGIQSAHPDQLFQANQQLYSVITDFLILCSLLAKKPQAIQEMQTNYWQDLHGLTQKQLTHWANWESMPIFDPRFNSEEWVQNPFFNTLIQQYLIFTKQIKNLLENIEYDNKVYAKRIKFFTTQLLDALSPSNFLHTNPQLLIETIQSQGRNLLEGLNNLLDDLEVDSSRLLLKMLDKTKFKVGEDLAATPGHVIYRNDMMELVQYTPQTNSVHKIPLLIIPPWINKYYVLDLSAENSFIQWIVQQEITVFVISWVNPDTSHAKKGLEHYLSEGPLEAIKIIQKQLSIDKVHLLGFCIGGTLAVCTLAYLKALKQDCIQSATLLASLVDFTDPGDISVWIDEEQISHIEEIMRSKGFLDGRIMANTFNLLRAKDLFWSFFVRNYLLGKKPVLFDMLYWNADFTNLPERMHSEYLRWMYLNNNLVKPNMIQLNQVFLDIQQVSLPTFFVGTEKDHIAPWKSIYLGFKHFQGEKTFLLGESGHIAGIINHPKNNKYGFYSHTNSNSNVNLDLTAEQWLEKSSYHSGSWWPEWIKWLKEKADNLCVAPSLDKLPFKPLESAPGSYIHKAYK